MNAADRFGSTVGQFVLTASLRSQVNATNRSLFKDVSPERCVSNGRSLSDDVLTHPPRRAFADFVVGSVVLHFFVFNFLG